MRTFSLRSEFISKSILIAFVCACLCLLACDFVKDFDGRLSRAYDSTTEYIARLVFDKTEYWGDSYHNMYARALAPTSIAYWLPGVVSHYFRVPLRLLSVLLFLLEPVLVILSVCFVAYRITGRPWISVAAGVLAYCGEAGYWNLGGFGYEKEYPYPPYLAYGCAFISIYYLLGNRPKLSVMWQVLTTLVHPSVGIHLSGILVFAVLSSFRVSDRFRYAPYGVGAVISLVIACFVSTLVFSGIPSESRASSDVVFAVMNQGHGAIWDNDWSATASGLLGFGFYAAFFFIAYRYLLRNSTCVNPVFLRLLLGSVVVALLGPLAKFLCRLTIHTRWCALVLPMHQLLFLRASHFTLVFMQMLSVWALLDMIVRTSSLSAMMISCAVLTRMALPLSYYIFGPNASIHLLLNVLSITALLLTNASRQNLSEQPKSRLAYLFRAVRHHLGNFLVAWCVSLLIVYYWGEWWEHPRRLMLLTITVYLLCEADWLASIKWARLVKSAIIVTGLLLTGIFWSYALATNASPSFVIVGAVVFTSLAVFQMAKTDLIGSVKDIRLYSVGLSMVFSLAGVVNVTELYSFDTPENQEWITVINWAKSRTEPGTSFLFVEAGDSQTRLPYGWRTLSFRGRIQLFDDALGLYYFPDLRLKESSEERRSYLAHRYLGKDRLQIIESMSTEDWRWVRTQSGATFGIARRNVRVNLPEVLHVGSFVVYRLPSDPERTGAGGV